MIITEPLPTGPDGPDTSDVRETDDGDRPESLQSSPASVDGTLDKSSKKQDKKTSQPPLPDEDVPPLPNEEVPPSEEGDGWDPLWDSNVQAYYFYNRYTHVTQWENPRVPASTSSPAPGVANHDRTAPEPTTRPAGGYDPSIHGDYDPNADYAKVSSETATDDTPPPGAPGGAPAPDDYGAAATFNRFTGKWQTASLTAENFNDENKSKRQMNAYFDVDAAANAHDGKSLKAERSAKKLSKKELKAFKEKRREKKEEKRRAWLRD